MKQLRERYSGRDEVPKGQVAEPKVCPNSINSILISIHLSPLK